MSLQTNKCLIVMFNLRLSYFIIFIYLNDYLSDHWAQLCFVCLPALNHLSIFSWNILKPHQFADFLQTYYKFISLYFRFGILFPLHRHPQKTLLNHLWRTMNGRGVLKYRSNCCIWEMKIDASRLLSWQSQHRQYQKLT